ncbi:MAG TPA: BON domain-containing protein [bacterium]|nr:BON domain-containing protein [bacterium]
MKKTLLLALLATLAGSTAWAAGSTTEAVPAPDNSAINARDTKGGPLTPENQSEKPEDRELTRKIRQAVMGEKDLSMTAKNIKIITVDGVVTLRGPVNTVQEREQIVSRALALAGNGNVNNLLEVKTTK